MLSMDAAPSGDWRAGLEAIVSLGRQDKRVRRLADLHEARTRHLGQFFTPLSIVRMVWRIAQEAFATVGDKRSINLLDNSVGTARMFHFADPQRFTLAGIDVHHDVIEATRAAAEDACFSAKWADAGMQDVILHGYDVALINPPFSIQLETPHLTALPCTRAGRFGPNTAATSDEYALAQALYAAEVVVAVLPTSSVADLLERGAQLFGDDAARLCAVFDLSRQAFTGEGASVATSVAVFGPERATGVRRHGVPDIEAFVPPALGLALKALAGKPVFKVRGLAASEPVITQPVTGDRAVGIVHSGRKIHLKTRCGFTQARVYNAVLGSRVWSMEGLRLSKGVEYAGQGLLDVEAILASSDPLATLERLQACIREADADPRLDVGLARYIARRMRLDRRTAAPFGHWVKAANLGNEVQAEARQTVALDDSAWTSPVVRKGERATLKREGEGWVVSKGTTCRRFTNDEAAAMFHLPATTEEWTQVHPPMQAVFPDVAQSLRERAKALGIDRWLNWGFQFDDLIEVSMKPRGAVVGWKQGLGKARLAAALILLRGVKAGLVAMPAYLLDEFEKRLQAAGLDASLWQIIRSPRQLHTLRTINVISYERLRMRLGPGSPQSYAKRLRHRIGLLVTDEGEVLANPESNQSHALAAISAPVWYVLTGTPIPNYPRDLLPISVAAVGDGVVGQPYGWHQPMLASDNAASMAKAVRGLDAFREAFVSVEWVTHEWTESMTGGAKREVPRVNNLEAYRAWLGTFVKRRLPNEPEVAEHVRIQPPDTVVHEVDFDPAHLAHYLRTADEFADWFRKDTGQKRMSNLMLLLARIGAVERACNVPTMGGKGCKPWRGGLTAKQACVIERVDELVQAGEKIVVFAKNPEQIELLQSGIHARGHETVLFHGGIDQARRNRELDQRFRYGGAPVLLATVGVMQAGWDLYQAQRALFVDRSWSAKIEDQAVRRLLRPQQTAKVTQEFFHLRGSIDEYQAQMVAWKASAADSGLDWAAPMGEDVDFLHLDHILEQFVDDLAKLRGVKRHELREQLKEAA